MSESTRPLAALRPHPENATIFGDPEESAEYDGIKASIKSHGIWEPLAIREDGTILSGHLRYLVAQQLALKTVPVRVVSAFASYRAEVEYIIRTNTDRRQLTKGEIALAHKRLRELPKDQGGTRRPIGRPKRGEEKSRESAQLSRANTRSDAAAAEILGVSEHEARALEKVFTTPGVPAELKAAVNRGTVAPTPAAKAVSAELKRQGGEIKDPSALKVIADSKRSATATPEVSHGRRVEAEADAYERDYRELFEIYKRLDNVLTRRPLKAVLGPTEHHQYRQMVRDVSLRAWREIETVEGETNVGKQMSLTVLTGGKP